MKKLLIIFIFLLAAAVFVFKFLPLGNPRGRVGGGFDNFAQAAAPRSGLVGYWTMDANDINGTTYYDRSGNNNTATSTGSPTIVAGQIKQAVKFNGSTQWMSARPNASGSNILTYAFWEKTTTISSFTRLFSQGKNGNGWVLVSNNTAADGYIRVDTPSISGQQPGGTPFLNLFNGAWHHVAITIDGTTNKINAWQDNVKKIDNTSYTGTLDFSQNIFLARDFIDNAINFNGSIDDVRIYNRALTATEVAQLYSSAKTTFTNSAPQVGSTSGSGRLVGYWTMDSNDVNGINYYDRSGLGNNATSTGSPTIAAGKINQAVGLNGTTQYLSNSSPPSFIHNKQGTMSAWVKINDLTISQTILAVSTNGSTTDEVRIDYRGNAGQILNFVVILGSVASFSGITANNVIIDKNWHLITTTSDGSSTKVYLDGINKALTAVQGSDSGQWFNSATNANIFTIGVLKRASLVQPLNGSIDDVRIYNYALSAQEVANLYQSAKQSYVASTVRRTGLVLDLNFGNNNGAAAPTVFDTSGNGRNATAAVSQTCNNQFCSFDGSTNYMTASGASLNNVNLSIAFKFNPNFDVGSSEYRFMDSSNGSRVELYSCSVGGCVSSNLVFGINGAITLGASIAQASPYWKKNQINTLIVVATSGSNKMYLNGTLIKSNATAWSAQNPATLYIGSTFGVGQLFSGKMYYMKVWNRLLTDAEVGILSADRSGYMR